MTSKLSSWTPPKSLLLGLAFLAVVSVVAMVLYFSLKQPETAPVDIKLMQPKLDFNITQALPKSLPLDLNKVALGQTLFNDVRLSGDNTISCASCHLLSAGGVDNRFRSIGIKGGEGSINTPTVFNSAFNFVQFWDGRAASLEDQIEGPINHPKEMGSNWAQIVPKLQAEDGYRNAFDKIYKDGINPNNIKDAIAAFDRSLLTPNSRFDQFLNGDLNAISDKEKHGYALFQSYGCASCHQGINLGGNMFEKMGLMRDYFADRGNLTEADNGRYNLTHQPENLHEFRVPSLRNIALTAPYFHDGNAKTLEEAINIMAKYQLGRPIPQDDVNDIVAFLHTLTGEYQGKPL